MTSPTRHALAHLLVATLVAGLLGVTDVARAETPSPSPEVSAAPSPTGTPSPDAAPAPTQPAETRAPAAPGEPAQPGAAAQPAQPDAPVQAAGAPPARPVQLGEVPPVDAGPDGTVSVQREPSKALQPIAPLAPLAPAAGAPAVPRAPVVAKPPVAPEPLTLPRRPGQELVDATVTDAIDTLRRAGRLKADGTPALDANVLQPQVSSATFIDPARPVTLQELIDALASGNIPPPLPVDPLALLQELPDGLPRITYRVCSESPTKAVSCSTTLPLAVPTAVDVTGDRTPDVLVDLLPAAALGDVTAAVRKVTDLERQINDVQTRLSALDELLKDPIYAITHPEKVLEAVNLRGLLANLRADLQDKLEALLDLVNLGLALLSLRLPTSETRGGPLPGHIWAVYDIPGRKRLSIGLDGHRRGTTLPTGALGIYTFNPLKALRGVYDIRATLLQGGAGDALAVTAGMSTVADTDEGEAIDPVVASARFSPVPGSFRAHALIDPGDEDSPQRSTVDATSDRATHLDTHVLSNGSLDRFTQLKVDTLPTTVSADLTRPAGGGTATLQYRAASTIDDVLFADFEYAGTRLDRAAQATAAAIPTSFDVALKTVVKNVELDYTASSRLAALDVAVLDRPGGIVGRGGLRSLPTAVKLAVDQPASHVTFTGAQALGSATVAISRNLGDFAPVAGDHATLITSGDKLGVSARVTGLRSVDAYYDGHPRLTATFEPGGQAFTGGADIDGIHKARFEISNLPATISLDADPVARKVVYQASSVVRRVHAAYTKTDTGPTLFATVYELPARVDIAYDLGEKPRVKYEATSRIPRLELFASPDHVENLRPEDDKYLSVAATHVPTAADVLVDLPARHLDGTLSQPLGSIAAVARFPLEGRDWTAMAELAGVPTRFDADFKEGTYRFRGITGPLESAKLAVKNHRAATTPTGLHVAAHYRQATGDIDASASVRKLTRVEYSRTAAGQVFGLELDTGGAPVFVDADVVLAAGGVDDTRLAALGRIDGVPNTVRVDVLDGKIEHTADRQVGLSLEVRAGKVAALDGLGAPLFENGAALVARACDTGAGCAKDETPFCTGFSRCAGLVGTVNLPGLPTKLTVDTRTRTVVLSGYRPPSAPLRAYVRLIGLVEALPDFRAEASLAGLPSQLDLTVGPIDVGTAGKVDVRYSASASLGSLRVDVDTTTTNPTHPVLRAKATVSRLPAQFHVSGAFGAKTTVSVRNSAPVDSIGVTVTGAESGYLQAGATAVPAQADFLLDLPAKHMETTMSAPIGSVSALAHVPFDGKNWSAYADVQGIPGKFDADFGAGTYRFRALSGPLGSAEFAVTNHAAADAPTGRHLAVYHRETTGALDASFSIANVSQVEYSHTRSDFTARFDSTRQTVGLDADVVLAAGGVDDTRLAALGTVGPIPGTITVGSAKGVVKYTADSPLDVEAQVWLGKVAALRGLGAPKFPNGISLVNRLCATGPGCASDAASTCVEKGCFGLTGIVNVTGLPSTVTIDVPAKKYGFSQYQPALPELKLYLDDRIFTPAPLTGGKVLATLTKLPPSLTLTVGPLLVGEQFDFKYVSNVVSAGRLDVWAEAYDVPTFGTARVRAVLDPIPGDVHVVGNIGANTKLKVDNTVPIEELSVRASGTFGGAPAAGLVEFTDVPSHLTFAANGFGETQGLNVSTLNYEAIDGRDTLDATLAVEARMVQKTDDDTDPTIATDGVQLKVVNLGHRTQIVFENEADKQLRILSQPKTDLVEVVGNIHVAVPRQSFDKKFLECTVITGRFYGHMEVKRGSRIEQITFRATNVKDMFITPGKVRTDLPLGIEFPEAIRYLFQAFRGDFGAVDVDLAGVRLDLDIDLYFRIDKIIGPDFFQEHVFVPPAVYDSVKFHKYDMNQWSENTFTVKLGPIPIFDIILFTKPGLVKPTTTNRVTIPGNQPSMISMLDPGDRVNDYIFDVLAFGTWPFDGDHTPKLKVGDEEEGGCPIF